MFENDLFDVNSVVICTLWDVLMTDDCKQPLK